MRGRFASQAVLAVLLMLQIHVCLATETPDSNNSSKYLDAVRTFADNVLKYGRDTYGPKHTPLFVDGLNIHTHEPVKWIDPDGTRWILSNFASQQTLLRTLDGLTAITGDPKYRQAAMDAIRYEFDHVRTPSGLFYWGHVTAYDALGDTPRGNTSHESIKLDYPYYELMWKVDPGATKKLIEALWCAHVMDWSNLDFNRIGPTTMDQEEPWNHEYNDGPTFFTSNHGGGGFFTTGTSLAQAGTALCRLSGEEQPLVWSHRLIRRYVKTRHPKTGISRFTYNVRWFSLGDDLKERCTDPYTTVFPLLPFEEGRGLYHPQNQQALPWISLFLTGDVLGKKGREFTQWALEELTAWGKNAYRKEDNSFIPILTDGTTIEGYVSKESSRNAPRGSVTKPLFADPTLLWAYSMAYRMTGDAFAWQMTHDIIGGNNLGDIGETSTQIPRLQVDTDSADVFSLLGFLELFKKTGNRSFLVMAQRIGDNILDNQFYKGFFVLSKRHIYTRFDCFEPLALLRLIAAREAKWESMPEVWPSSPLFVPAYRYKQQGVDRRIIYTLTESTEPPLSIQEAAAIGDVNTVRSLLESGIGVDSWDDSLMKTALQHAAMRGYKEVVALLLDKGARIDAQDDWPGGTALDYAAERGHKEVVELLIARGADVNAKRGYPAGDTPLHSAARAGHKNIIELLIANGADVNAKNNEGQTPVDIAASRNRSKVVRLLIEKGADVSLDVAVRIGALAKVKSLIEEGVDINARDGSGNTALYYAVRARHKEIAELLLTKGADINLAPRDGNPLLNVAIWRGYTEMAKLLVNHGAKFDVKDEDGCTAFRYAADGGHRELVGFFVSKGADISSFHMAACVGDLTRMKHFVDEGVNVDTKDELGWTPLCWAASTGQMDAVEFLIANGANVDAKTDFKRTPLHQAAIVGELNLVQLFISRGANVNVKDWRGRTPLWWANRRGHTEIVELLKKHVANLASNSEPRHDLAITGISAVKRDLKDYNVPVVVRIENHGDFGESFDVKLIDTTDSTTIGTKSAYLSPAGIEGMDNKSDIIFTGESPGHQYFGCYVYHGDVNGDGYDDLLVTASRYDDKKGRAYLYYGRTDMDENADKVFTGEKSGDYFSEGSYLADLNNDGYDDVILGAFGHNNFQGRVYIYYGGHDMDERADIIMDGEPGIIDGFGRTCAAGDVNGDGYKDLFVSAIKYPNAEYKGRIYLYYGGDPMDTTCDLILTGENTGDVFGWRMDASGDIDGDNYCDLITGTRFWPKTAPEGKDAIGRAYLYYGGDPMDGNCDVIFTGENINDQFGVSLDLDDVDNDGLADIFIGARGYDGFRGKVNLYWGKPKEYMSNKEDKIFMGENRGGAFGGDDIEVGYIDDDNFKDIMIMAYHWSSGRGRTYLYYGNKKADLDTHFDNTFSGTIRDNFPFHATVGDFNKDGYGDLVVGGWRHNNYQGRAWLYYGGPGDSRQMKFDWKTGDASPGKHLLKATIAPVAGEKDMSNNTVTVDVEVKKPLK